MSLTAARLTTLLMSCGVEPNDSMSNWDMLQHLRQQARRALLAESRKHPITAKLRQIPYLGPIRSAAMALIQTSHRFSCGPTADWPWRPGLARNTAAAGKENS